MFFTLTFALLLQYSTIHKVIQCRTPNTGLQRCCKTSL